jgi:hypothetical protein
VLRGTWTPVQWPLPHIHVLRGTWTPVQWPLPHIHVLRGTWTPVQWAVRLKRVFEIDIERCPECGGNVRVIACIEAPPIIAIILAHVRGREAATAKGVARAPPVRDEARLVACNSQSGTDPGDESRIEARREEEA